MIRRMSWLVTLSLLVGLAGPTLAQDSGTKERAATDYEWVLHYYMAYDNNLEACGDPIIQMLDDGITNDKTVVVVSADYRNADGMKRYILTNGERKVIDLEEEGSAEEEVLETELNWVRDNYKGKRYAVVFLNHGGQLGQMSYDETPGKAGGQNWLYPPEVGKVMTKWRKTLPGEMELFFYQQCGKGTLENYHAVKDSAKFVMGSQTTVGAPNYYYTKFVKDVCENPAISGKEVAASITKHETPNMFTTYSTFDSAALGTLPANLNPVLEPLLKLETLQLPPFSRTFRPCFKFQPDEMMFDAFALLDGLYTANNVDKAPLETFKGWVKESLMTGHRVSPQQERLAGDWCGFSIYVPARKEALTRYQSTYPIYSETKLGDLCNKLIESLDALRAKRSAPKASTPKKERF